MKSKLPIILTFLLMTSIAVHVIAPVKAQATAISVLNSDTGDVNFTFSTDTTSVGTRFNATLWVYDVVDLFAYQVQLNVNDTLLNITNAWLPTANSSWVFFGKATIQPQPSFRDTNVNSVMEGVLIGDTILVGATFAGSGLLAIIEFEIVFAPTIGGVSSSLDIDNVDTFLLDFSLAEISIVTKTSGNYEFQGPMPKPPTASFTYLPMAPLINETVAFDASGSTPNGGAIVSYSWDFGDGNTTTLSTPTITHIYTSAGDFNVTLTVEDDEGFSDTTWTIITIHSERVGDLNNDGKIDIKDIGIAAVAFGSFPGHPRWNPDADINRDGKVSMKDIVIIASNFGKFV